MGVNSLPKTVTRQRRDCDLNPGPSASASHSATEPPFATVLLMKCAANTTQRLLINADLEFTFPPPTGTLLVHMDQLARTNGQLLRPGAFVRRHHLNHL